MTIHVSAAETVHQMALFANSLGSTLVVRNEATIKGTATVAATESFYTAAFPCFVSEVVSSASGVKTSLEPSHSNGTTTSSQTIKFSCPSLSLQHGIQGCGFHGKFGSNDNEHSNGKLRSSSDETLPLSIGYNVNKNDVEKHAETLLKRPIECCIDKSQLRHNDGCVHALADGFLLELISTKPSNNDKDVIPQGVLSENLARNLHSSFSILVESRLHAYSVYLARKALTITKRSHFGANEIESPQCLDKIMKALDTVMNVGNLLTVRTVTTKFKQFGTPNNVNSGQDLQLPFPSPSVRSTSKGDTMVETEIGLMLLVTLECHIPTLSSLSFSHDKSIFVDLNAPGSMKALVKENRLDSINITIDTKILLANMIQEVIKVVETVMQCTTLSCSHTFQPPSSSHRKSCANVGSLMTSVGQDEVPITIEEEECSRNNDGQQKRTINRSASYMAMPPPLPLKKGNIVDKCVNHSNYGTSLRAIQKHLSNDEFSVGLDLLTRAAFYHIHAVSPEVSAIRSTDTNPVTVPSRFDLSSTSSVDELENKASKESQGIDPQQHQLDFVSNLSPDDCANIIDACLSNISCFDFFDDDDDAVVQGRGCGGKKEHLRCTKRAKLC